MVYTLVLSLHESFSSVLRLLKHIRGQKRKDGPNLMKTYPLILETQQSNSYKKFYKTGKLTCKGRKP